MLEGGPLYFEHGSFNPVVWYWESDPLGIPTHTLLPRGLSRPHDYEELKEPLLAGRGRSTSVQSKVVVPCALTGLKPLSKQNSQQSSQSARISDDADEHPEYMGRHVGR